MNHVASIYRLNEKHTHLGRLYYYLEEGIVKPISSVEKLIYAYSYNCPILYIPDGGFKKKHILERESDFVKIDFVEIERKELGKLLLSDNFEFSVFFLEKEGDFVSHVFTGKDYLNAICKEGKFFISK